MIVVGALALTNYLIHRNGNDHGIAGTLRIGVMESVDSLNPFVGLSFTSKIAYGLLYDCLHAVGEDMDTEGNLAASWMIDDSYEPRGSAWQYNLTENAQWHDGEPFDAYDVEFTLNLHALNYTNFWSHNSYAYFVNYAEAIDNSTVRVHFCDRSTGEPIPVAFADSLLIPIMPEHMLGDMTATSIGFQWTGVFEGHDPPIVGTGPFRASETVWNDLLQGRELTLERNPLYHRAADRGEEISFDKIVIRVYEDATAMRIALEVCDIDVASFPHSEFATLSSMVGSGSIENVELSSGLSCAQRTALLSFGMNYSIYGSIPNPSVRDHAIRQAMSMAINKSFIIDEHYCGYAEAGTALISPISQEWHCETVEPPEFDPVAAAELLEEHGYEYTDASPEVRVATLDSLSVASGWVEEGSPLIYRIVLMPSDYHFKDAVESWASDWSDIGVTINLTAYPGPAIPYMPPPADIYISTVVAPPVDPNYVLFQQSTRAYNGWNLYGYSNGTYDQHYMDSVLQLDAAERRESVMECQKTYCLDAGAVVLAYLHQTYAWTTNTFAGWGNWSEHPGRSIDCFWGGNQLYFDLELIWLVGSSDSVNWIIAFTVAGAIIATVASISYGCGAIVNVRRIPP